MDSRALIGILASNDVPTPHQAATLCDLLQRIAPAVDDVRDTVHLLSMELHRACQARERVSEDLRRVLGDLSALRLFPSELLAEVFSYLCTDERPITDARNGLGPVLRVCSAWRATALAEPRLWATVRLPFWASRQGGSRLPPVVSPEASAYLDGILRRSGSLRLSVRIRGPWQPNLRAFCDRLASLDLTASDDDLSTDPPSFPSLVSLRAECPPGPEEHSAVLQRTLAAFSKAPLLATLTVHLSWGLFSLAALTPAWPNLSTVHLTSVFDVDVLYEVLLCVPLLSDFAFESRSIIGDSFTAPSLPSLPRLKSISARLPPEDARQLFDALDCPNLEELSFSWARIHHQAVLDFASRCRCQISTLTIDGVCPVSALSRFGVRVKPEDAHTMQCVEEAPFRAHLPSEWSVAFPAVRNLVLLITLIPSLAFYADAVVISPFLDDLSLDGARDPPLVHLSRELEWPFLDDK
ncbi:hypothetical protein C8R43DRAFT_1118560 [Mycena crocata]|nr:hypothetical protein C8R43DRAFT_1118560 [Mycena crocata]